MLRVVSASDLQGLWHRASRLHANAVDYSALKAFSELRKIYSVMRFPRRDSLSNDMLDQLDKSMHWIIGLLATARDRDQRCLGDALKLTQIAVENGRANGWTREIECVVCDLVNGRKLSDSGHLCCCAIIIAKIVGLGVREKERNVVYGMDTLESLCRDSIRVLKRMHDGWSAFLGTVAEIRDFEFLKRIGVLVLSIEENFVRGYRFVDNEFASKEFVLPQAEILDSLDLLYKIRYLFGVRRFFASCAETLSESGIDSFDHSFVIPYMKKIANLKGLDLFQYLKIFFALIGLCSVEKSVFSTNAEVWIELMKNSISCLSDHRSRNYSNGLLLALSFCAICVQNENLIPKEYLRSVSDVGSRYAVDLLCFIVDLKYPISDSVYVDSQKALFAEAPIATKGLAILLRGANSSVKKDLFFKIHSVIESSFVLWRSSIFHVSEKTNSISEKMILSDKMRPSNYFLSMVISLKEILSVSLEMVDQYCPQIINLLSLIEFSRVKFKPYIYMIEVLCKRGDSNEKIRNDTMNLLMNLNLSDETHNITANLPIITPGQAFEDIAFSNMDRPCLGRLYFKIGIFLRWAGHFSEDFVRTLMIHLSLSLIDHQNKMLNIRAHMLFALCISKFKNLASEFGMEYAKKSINGLPQRVQIVGFTKGLSTLFKQLSEQDPIKHEIQRNLLEKITRIMQISPEPPKPLTSLLFHSIQWVGLKQLNESLTILEELFEHASAPQRASLSVIMSTVLSNRFDATIKDHCIDWYLRIVQSRKIPIIRTQKKSNL